MSTTIWTGLSVGAVYGLGAILLTITLVRCGVMNFAILEYVVLAGYLTNMLLGWGWSTLPIVLVLAVAGAALAVLQELLTIRPVSGRPESVLITTIAMIVIIQGFILVAWGTTPRTVPFFGGSESLHVLGGIVQPGELTLIGLVLLVGSAFQLCVSRTRWGIVGRATMTDQEVAMLRGVNIRRMRTLAFALAGGLAFALAAISAPKTGVSLESSLHILVFAFAAAAVGGFGSFSGAVVGGFVIGLVEAFAARYLSVEWVPIVVFVLLISTLLIRPTGLLGQKQLRAV